MYQRIRQLLGELQNDTMTAIVFSLIHSEFKLGPAGAKSHNLFTRSSQRPSLSFALATTITMAS